MKCLLLYSSVDGHTKHIIAAIAERLSKSHGIDCHVQNLHDFDCQRDLGEYSRVLVGASIRYGKFNKSLYRFSNAYHKHLQTIPNTFFAVNLSARQASKSTPETSSYVRKFVAKSPWTPARLALFPGALYYPRYTFFDRVMIKFIMWLRDGETDTTKEIVYTDWQAVRGFADTFSALTIHDMQHAGQISALKQGSNTVSDFARNLKLSYNTFCASIVLMIASVCVWLFQSDRTGRNSIEK